MLSEHEYRTLLLSTRRSSARHSLRVQTFFNLQAYVVRVWVQDTLSSKVWVRNSPVPWRSRALVTSVNTIANIHDIWSCIQHVAHNFSATCCTEETASIPLLHGNIMPIILKVAWNMMCPKFHAMSLIIALVNLRKERTYRYRALCG
jgi:hypothetical protein